MNVSIPLIEGEDDKNKKDDTTMNMDVNMIGPTSLLTLPEDHNNNEGLIDITDDIIEYSESLTYKNPLLCIKSFNLMDSMSALVLMDPSMDSCQQLQIPQPTAATTAANEVTIPNNNMIRKAPTSLLDMSLWDNNISYENVKDYSHEILIRLNAFLSGCGVAESTYTCLYAHDNVLEDMRDAYNYTTSNTSTSATTEQQQQELSKTQCIIYTITLLFVKVCVTIRTIVQHADIYEEEDFVMNAYSFRFFSNYVNEDELNTTVNDTLKMIMLLNSKNGDSDSLKGIWLCLGYLWNFYKCCNSLTKMVPQNLAQQIAKTKRMLHSSTTQLNQLEKLYSSSLKNSTNNISSSTTINNNNNFLNEAFDININRNLFGNAPVRKVQFKSFHESIQHLTIITNEFNTNICDFLLVCTSFTIMKNMLRRLSSCDCNILTRSILILNLYFDDLFLGQYLVNNFIEQALVDEAGLDTKSLLIEERHHLSTFLNRLGKPIYDWLKVFLLNKNRQRDYMETFMFREWSNLQKEVIPVSTSPHLTNFILYTTMDIMDHFHILSLEIHLVHGHYDYSIAYWYRTFILSAMINLLVTMINAKKEVKLLEQQLKQQEPLPFPQKQQQQNHKNNRKGNQRHKKNNGSNNSFHVAKKQQYQQEEEEDAQLLILGLRRSLCRGIAQYITALHQSKYLIKPDNYEFTTQEQRFIKRFESFSLFPQPPHLQYDDFLQGTDYSNVSPLDLISSASECFKTSKLLADKLLSVMNKNDNDISSKSAAATKTENSNMFLPIFKKEITSLVKVCVGNSLYLHILSQQVTTTKKEKKKKPVVKFDFDTHSQFCIIQIV